jgi:hypothetical protein
MGIHTQKKMLSKSRDEINVLTVAFSNLSTALAVTGITLVQRGAFLGQRQDRKIKSPKGMK